MSNPSRDVFNTIVDNATRNQLPNPIITQSQYEEWKKQYTLDGLQGLRYGQSFCNRHGVADNILYYVLNSEEADRYIKDKYVERQ